MARLWKVVPGVVLAVALVSLPGCMVRSDTLPAMIAAADALKKRDVAEFERHVDLDSLLGQVVDVALGQTPQEKPGLFDRLLGRVVAYTKPKLVELSKGLVEKVISTGTVTGLAPDLVQLPTNQGVQGLVWVFGVPGDKKNYKITEVQKTQDGEVLKLEVAAGQDQPPLPLHIQSEKRDGQVRLVQIANLADIYPRLLKMVLP